MLRTYMHIIVFDGFHCLVRGRVPGTFRPGLVGGLTGQATRDETNRVRHLGYKNAIT